MKKKLLHTLAITALVGTSISNAQTYSYNWQAPAPAATGGNAAAWQNIFTSYNSDTNVLTFSATLDNSVIDGSQYGPFDPGLGEDHSWELVNFVVTDGVTPDSSSNPATHAVFFLDYNSGAPILSAYEYDFNFAAPVTNPTPVSLSGSIFDVTNSGDLRTFSLSTSLNGSPLLSNSQFEERVGLWANAWADPEIVYDNGAIVKYDPGYLANGSLTNTAFWDLGNGFTNVPEPSTALLGALGLLGLVTRRRRV